VEAVNGVGIRAIHHASASGKPSSAVEVVALGLDPVKLMRGLRDQRSKSLLSRKLDVADKIEF
jgi:hypothetical protein